MPEIPAPRVFPVPTTSRRCHITFCEMLRLALFLILPAYARIHLFSPLPVVLSRIYVIGSTGICVVHFSEGDISLSLVWDVVYALLVASFPNWSQSILRVLWVGSEIGTWRWEVVYWAFVIRKLAYLLPKHYGSDIEAEKAVLQEYQYTYPQFGGHFAVLSALIVYYALWPKGCPWYDGLLIWSAISSFIEFVYLAIRNYVRLRTLGTSMRQDLWLYRDIDMNEYAFIGQRY